MTTKRRTMIALVPIVALLVAVALAPVSAEASPFGFPAGTYTTTITDADYPPGFPDEAKAPGNWELEFTEDGRFIVTYEPLGVVVEGRYLSNPARLVATEESGPFACFNLHPGWATGVYQWTFENDELTLTAVHDDCEPRVRVLMAHPLQKQ